MKKVVQLALISLLLAAVFGGCRKSEKVITSLDDAKNANIGVMTGTTEEALAVTRFPKAQVKRFDDIMDAVTALKSGQVDAVITSYSTSHQLMKSNQELWCLPESLHDDENAVAIKKGNHELLAELDRIITEMKGDGTLADIKKRWFKPGLDPYELREIALPANGKILRIGVSATREPISFVDKDGRVTGHDGEIARIIGAKLQRPVAFVDMKFMALIPSLQSGKIDMVLSGLTATDERRKSVDFTQPYFVDPQIMIVKKAAGMNAASAAPVKKSAGNNNSSKLDKIDGKSICVLPGSAGDLAARKKFPKSSFQVLAASADAAFAVKTGKADAFVYDKSVLLNIVDKNPELVILDEPISKLEVAAAIRKDNSALLADMNAALTGLKAKGVLKTLRTKWVDSKYSATPALPAVKDTPRNGILKMGTSATIEPFSFQADGRFTGLDIELAQLIGELLGKKIVIVDMAFDGLIPALQSGKIDFALSNFNVTAERQKLVSFSLPYVENDISALVRRDSQTDSADGQGIPSVPFLAGIADSFRSNIIQEKRYLLIWDGLKTTVAISIFSTVFGTLLGALVCFMRMSEKWVLNLPAKIYIAVLRGTPVLVFLMLIFYVVFASISIDPLLVAVIAFGMNFAAYVAEIFRTGIEGVDKGQTEAGIAMGFTKVATFINIVLPQTVRRILPIYKGEFISLVKMTSIVGYIAVQDLTKASDIIRSRTFDAFFPLIMVAILYFLISWVLMQSLEYVERITDPKSRRKKVRKL